VSFHFFVEFGSGTGSGCRFRFRCGKKVLDPNLDSGSGFWIHNTVTQNKGYRDILYSQGFGSGSVLDPYSIGPLDPDPDP
jgi:hypothetical protein